MNSEERIIKVLLHEELDRVPFFEWAIDPKVINGLYPGLTMDEFIYKMDLDAVCVSINFKQEELEPGLFRDEWGIIQKYNGEDHAYPISGPIKSLNDFKKYVAPDPHIAERFLTLEQKQLRHKGKKAVLLHLNDVFSIPSRLFGFENLLMALTDDPKLVHELINLSVDYNLELAGEAVKRGVRIVYTGDDYAYNNGPMVSPNQFKEFFYPGLCKVIKGFKDLGLYVIKHTDGYIMPIIDLIIESGIDCLDPIDPIAGMDLATIKQKYGKRVAIKGNVDCAKTLTFGNREDVITETKNCLRIGAPNGGYILSSSNSIHSTVKPDNFAAMVETHKKYGNYPLCNM